MSRNDPTPRPRLTPRPPTPTDGEMRAEAVRLGLLDEGDSIPPRLRGRLARAVTARAELAAAQSAMGDRRDHDATAEAFASTCATVLDKLDAAGIPADLAHSILSNASSSIWTTTERQA